jgi:parallel beta-helix repeat protein
MRRRAAGGSVVLVVALVATTGAATAAPPAGRSDVVRHWDGVVSAAARLGATGRAVPAIVHGEPVLVVRRDATLRGLARALPRIVTPGPAGTMTVQRTVIVLGAHRLRIDGVREVRLLSRHGRTAHLIGLGAHFAFRATAHGARLKVRSWDPAAAGGDRRLDDARAVISVRRHGRLDAADTDFRDLGFSEGRWSGFALNQRHGAPRPTGRVERSTFVGNYFGAYTYAAVGMRWIANRFDDNIVYGLDPHDDSDGFLVAGNRATGNGRHGIIFSRLCDDNVIRDNVASGNRWHGIVVDDGRHADGPSNDNIIMDNVVRDNGLVGISVDGSSKIVIARNRVLGGRDGIRVFGPASLVAITGNDLRRPTDAGILLDAPSTRIAVVANRVVATANGLRLRGTKDVRAVRNAMEALGAHGVLATGDRRHPLRATVIRDNRITGAGASPIAVGGSGSTGIRAAANDTRWDFPAIHDAARALRWIGGGAWLALVVLALLGPRVTAAAAMVLRRAR